MLTFIDISKTVKIQHAQKWVCLTFLFKNFGRAEATPPGGFGPYYLWASRLSAVIVRVSGIYVSTSFSKNAADMESCTFTARGSKVELLCAKYNTTFTSSPSFNRLNKSLCLYDMTNFASSCT